MIKKKSILILVLLIFLIGSLYYFFLSHDIFEKEKGGNAQLLTSFYDNEYDYQSAFSNVTGVEKQNIIAGMTSHHFLAKDLIARFFAGIGNRNVQTVILVGPDHYNKLNYSNFDAATTYLNWKTPFGQLNTNANLIGRLFSNSNIFENDKLFYNEHSIYTLIPFMKKQFPNAMVVPLVIKNTYDYEKYIKLGQNIRSLSDENTIMIVSSDFSHNMTTDQAKEKDSMSIKSLQNFSSSEIGSINCDCRACMAVMLGFIGEKNSFKLVENKSSTDFGSPDPTVTSYVSGYYLKP